MKFKQEKLIDLKTELRTHAQTLSALGEDARKTERRAADIEVRIREFDADKRESINTDYRPGLAQQLADLRERAGLLNEQMAHEAEANRAVAQLYGNCRTFLIEKNVPFEDL